MKRAFTIFWKFNKSELIHGADIADAFSKAGYGNGATRAVDFYVEGNVRSEYFWCKEDKTWKKGERRNKK